MVELDVAGPLGLSNGAIAGFILGAFALGAVIAFGVRAWMDRVRKDTLKRELAAEQAAAEAQAQKTLASADAEAKQHFIELREKFDRETNAERQELREEERRLAKREDTLDGKLDDITKREKTLEASQQALHEREHHLAEKDKQIDELLDRRRAELHRVANMSPEEARKTLLDQVEKDMEREVSELVSKKIEEANEAAEGKAREIIVNAIQRYAAEHTSDSTVSAVDIPSDDMKGRVIGREGRNIRAFEKATGVDVIVDDTPGVVVVSAFDPVRREIARRTMEKLIQDGRIHPTRIEEIAANVEKEVMKQISEYGKQAVIDANVRGLHGKLLELLGRLHFRTSYGQNVLKHSMEVAYLSQVIADQLGLNSRLARRCGLLHDIGKAVDHEVEGGHPQIGAELCKRYGEKDEVIASVGGHHGDLAVETIYQPIVAAADAISAARPGARRESLERYVQRLQKLEEIATNFDGVDQAYAIQAGREVRVIVDASKVDDRISGKIARDIARRVEDEMEYPGEIKVTLVREVRHVEYAR